MADPYRFDPLQFEVDRATAEPTPPPTYGGFGDVVSALWRSLPPHVRNVYGTIPAAIGELSPGAGARDMVQASGELSQNVMAGNPLAAAGSLAGIGLGAMGMLPGARVPAAVAKELSGAERVAKALADQPQGIRAYHGSPHQFDKFDLAKIGTGEGAQAYGHGLYFAENEAVAQGYRKASDDALRDINAQMSALARDMRQYEIPGQFGKYKDPRGQALKAEYDRLMDARSGLKGHMYEVNINADPAKMLDWDKPLRAQADAVQHIARTANFPGAKAQTAGMMRMFKDGAEQEHNLATGQTLYRALSSYGDNAVGATEAMTRAGIPGIQYLDAGSRAVGDGTRNFVIFDPSRIEILRRYGWVPLGVAAGGGTLMAAPDAAQAKP